jgi:hypothetical protein
MINDFLFSTIMLTRSRLISGSVVNKKWINGRLRSLFVVNCTGILLMIILENNGINVCTNE